MLDQLIQNIRKKLPIQNPLHSFVHNNILLMFEDRDFHDALEVAGKLYRAQTYWPIYKYQEKYEEKKISEPDILRAIDHYLGHYKAIPSVDLMGLTPKEYFYRLMFSELAFMDEDYQPDITDQHLWDACQEKMNGQSVTLSRSRTFWRGKEYWEKYQNETYALSLNPLIIRLISSYLDQGQSFWANPFTGKSFWEFFLYDISSQKGYTSSWRDFLVKKVEQYRVTEPLEVISTELKAKGIPEEVWETYLLEILFDLKGWAGMVNKLEVEPWQATVKAPAIKLVDYIAALVLMESAMDTYHAEQNSIDLSMIHGRQEKIELRGIQLAAALYSITKDFKLNDRWMQRLEPADILKLIDEVDSSNHKDKIRLWHEAYEHHFHADALEAFGNHKKQKAPAAPYAQALFCIDDREESIRRHVEETDPNLETFGVVGFFNIDMKFSSHKNTRLIAQCPPVITPTRIITEFPKNNPKEFHERHWLWGSMDLRLYYQSRTLVRGFFSTLFLGIASVIPMILQVFFPHTAKSLREKFHHYFTNESETDLAIESDGQGHGYTKEEQASIVEAIIKMCAFQSSFSDLVVIVGHGSTSTNNPFKQAYGCGACGGNAGIPNSRAFAKMANDSEVRKILAGRGMNIPATTFFVSGYHDTSTDEMHFFNTKDIPSSHLENFKRVRRTLEEAGKRNAYERCSRFSSFDQSSGPNGALEHVRERADDLAQPRPEYGHNLNALAVVGKRELTKGLYLNRRSFLLSYDWKTDPDGSVLKQVVIGGIPVAVNINMDYYFSCVDNDNFGCGSKLPLNLTSLLGVMTGSMSDLRIGLARQMVEIHEPIRNLTLIEAPLERVKTLFESHPRLKNILYHHWFRLAVKDPETDKWYLFGQSEFEEINFEKSKLKVFNSSLDVISKVQEENFAEINV